MRTASEHLVQTTWMAEHELFKNFDNVTPVNWAKVWDFIDVLDHSESNNHMMVMIAVLEFLCGSDATDVSLYEIARLPELDRQAVVEALRLQWSKVQVFQENLD
jgi:hypothetical protein